MSDHLAQKPPVLNSALQDNLTQLCVEIRAWVVPYVSTRIKQVRNDLSNMRGKSREPTISKPVLLIPGKIDRGPPDGWSMIVVAADSGYTWQFRRYGSPVMAHGANESFVKAEEAWNAGRVALDRHRAARSQSPAYVDGSARPAAVTSC